MAAGVEEEGQDVNPSQPTVHLYSLLSSYRGNICYIFEALALLIAIIVIVIDYWLLLLRCCSL